MSWATHVIARLAAGETVRFRPRGHSMTGRINDGQLVTMEPNGDVEPRVGDAVLCTVRGRDVLHLVKAIRGHGEQRRWLIGNNHGKVDGWTPLRRIYGRCVRVGD